MKKGINLCLILFAIFALEAKNTKQAPSQKTETQDPAKTQDASTNSQVPQPNSAANPVFANPTTSFETPAPQAILIDAATGEVLFSKNPDEQTAPSSMTKMLTAYIVIDLIKQGRLKEDQLFTVSKQAYQFDGSTMFLNIDQNVPVIELLKGLIIVSGNDAAITLAEGISGTEASFAGLMNDYAKRLGMTKSHFVNASGYPDPNNYSTVRDLALLARHVVFDHPTYYPLHAQVNYRFNDVTQQNRNPLLHRTGTGCDGIKTGYSQQGGYGMAASIVRNNRRLIAVVNGLSTQQTRADAAANLLNWGMTNFENVVVVQKGDQITKVAVEEGKEPEVTAYVAQPVFATVLAGQASNVKKDVTPMVLKAPIAKDQVIGEMVVTSSLGTVQKVQLLALTEVEQANLFARGWYWLIRQIQHLIGKA